MSGDTAPTAGGGVSSLPRALSASPQKDSEAGARPAGGVAHHHPVLSGESNPEASRPSTHRVCSLLFLRAFIILDIVKIFDLFVISLF